MSPSSRVMFGAVLGAGWSIGVVPPSADALELTELSEDTEELVLLLIDEALDTDESDEADDDDSGRGRRFCAGLPPDSPPPPVVPSAGPPAELFVWAVTFCSWYDVLASGCSCHVMELSSRE